jgi:methionyl-tRNA formyltransferase
MEKYVLVSEKKWHDELFRCLKKSIPAEWIRIVNEAEFTMAKLEKIDPKIIFIPHWSHIIPAAIYDRYECIVFHMTDLPFGRGGSPLQNLIVRGLQSTKLSALRVEKGIDTGKIYLKKNLSLGGTAQEIFLRASDVIQEMIIEIVREQIIPVPQVGDAVEFKRRIPEDGNIAPLKTLNEVYDYIRMLDCEGYPNAFITIGEFRLEFSNAKFVDDNQTISAHVRITKK